MLQSPSKATSLSYHEIEQYMNMIMKVHHSTANQESAFIAKVSREVQQFGENTTSI